MRAGVVTLAACASLFGALAQVAMAAETPALTFEKVFSAAGEPANLYYRGMFGGHDGSHTLQVWRDGQSRLRRRTDAAIDTYVIRDPSDPTEYQMIVVDYQKRITNRIDRNNLIRLGHFSDWFDLAHGLRHPVGPYRLYPVVAPDGIPAPVAKCRWYELQQAQGSHRVCWSERDRLPLVIWSPQKGTLWHVTEVTRQPISAATFERKR